MTYRVKICVREVRGYCSMGYKPGDCFLIEKYYIRDAGRGVCLHALASMLTLLSLFLKGISARDLGIGEEDYMGYV